MLGIERAGRWPREQSRREQLEYLKARRGLFLWFSVVVVGVCGALLFFWPGIASGVVVGAAASSCAWAIAVVTLQQTGTAATLMGAAAETWTAEQLRVMRPRGWTVIHAIPLKYGDLDHLAISPAGVFAFETKWSGTPWFAPKQSRHLETCVAQARDRAELFSRRRSFFGLKAQPVRPVLVLWGPSIGEAAEEQRTQSIGDVTVVAGPWLAEWAGAQSDAVLGEVQVAAATTAAEEVVRVTEPHLLSKEERSRYVVGGIDAVLSDLVLGPIAGAAALAVVTLVGVAVGGSSWPTYFGVTIVLTALAWLAWRLRWRTAPFLGWALGSTGSVVVMGLSWAAGSFG